MRNAPASGRLDRRYRTPPMREASPARSPPARRAKRRKPGHGDERHAEGGDVEPVDERESGVGDEHTGGSGADDQGRLESGRLHRQGGGQIGRGHQPPQRRAPGRPVHALEGGGLGRADEHRPEQGMPEHCVDGQPGAAGRQQHLGDEHDFAPVPGVHCRAAEHRSGQQRHQLPEAHQSHHGGRAGQPVGLVADRHHGQLAAHGGDHLTGPQPPEPGVPPQRAGVHEHPAHVAAHACKRGRHAASGGDGYSAGTVIWRILPGPAVPRPTEPFRGN